MLAMAESEDQILLPSESDEVGAPRCKGGWRKVVGMGVVTAAVFCVSVASISLPGTSVAGGNLHHLTGLSAAGGASTLDQEDDTLGFPIYFSRGPRIQTESINWIVEFKGDDDTIAENKKKAVQAFGQKIVFDGVKLNMLVIEGSLAQLKLGLKHCNPDEVEFVEQDTTVKALVTNHTEKQNPGRRERRLDIQKNPPWGLDRIDQRDGPANNGFEADASLKDGEGVHVYVFDTGIRATHTDFGGRAIPALESFRKRAVECAPTDSNCADDKHGHGTHCAGTVAGKKYGVAKKAKVYAVKVLSDGGRGSTAGIAKAYDWVIRKANRPAVVSMSLGSHGRSRAHRDGVNKVTESGIIVVVAAGNENTDACEKSPAHVHTALTVGATTIRDHRAAFSNWGPCVDIFAPGKGILSAGHRSDTGAAKFSGTSMACPHVSGAAALILARSPNKTPQQITAELQQSATQGKVQDSKVNSPHNLLLFVGKKATATPKVRPIKWATHPEKCLDVSGGTKQAGTNIQLWDCVNEGEHDNMQFLIPESGNGPIRWAKHPTMCLDVQGGKTHNGVNLQLWHCSDDGQHANMQFIVPAHQGNIKWAHHEKCIDVDGGGVAVSTNIQMWDCVDGGQHANMQFIVDES